jgi:hypothetical protein
MTFAFTLFLYTPSIVASGGVESIVANRIIEKKSLPWNDFLHRFYPHVRTVFSDFSRNIPDPALFMGAILLIAGILRAAKRRDWALLLLLPSMLLGAAAVFLIKHSIPPPRIWIYWVPFPLVLADSGFTYFKEKLPRTLQFLFPLLLVALGSFYAVSLMSRDAIVEGPFPEAPFVAQYLKPLISSNDAVHVGDLTRNPMRFYLWYYGIPYAKKTANLRVGKEFFVVKKSRYTINDLTEKPVMKLLDFGDAALYQLLPTEEIPTEKAMDRPRRGTVPR